MAAKALTAVVQEACVQGMSTRSVDEPAKAMGMSGVPNSRVSRLCEKVDGRVKEPLSRPIEGDWRWLRMDATCMQVRRGVRIVPVAVSNAVGVNIDSPSKVLGVEVRLSPS